MLLLLLLFTADLDFEAILLRPTKKPENAKFPLVVTPHGKCLAFPLPLIQRMV